MSRDHAGEARPARFTEGWFQIAWSKELPRGAVRRLTCFGEELVLFREEGGAARVLDAYCPHLGAHLGVGGKVVGGCLRCPFHGWLFDGDGTCAKIPYAQKIPPKARVFSWPVVERDGMLFVWRASARRAASAPTRSLPTIDGFHADAWTEWTTYAWTLRARSLDILENAVDSPHFKETHGNGAARIEVIRSGPVLELKQHTSGPLLGVEVPATLHYLMFEPGFHLLRLDDLPITPALIVSSITPIDGETVVNRLSIALRRRGGGPLGRLAISLLREIIARRMMATYREDTPIWENKTYRESPALCDGDGPIMMLRRWYAGFEPEPRPAGEPLVELRRPTARRAAAQGSA